MSKSLYYWDTSALLPLIFSEPSTKIIQTLVEKESPFPAYTSFVTKIEIESALNRRIIEGSLGSDLSEIRLMIQELEKGLLLVWPNDEILKVSCKKVSEFNIRPADAIHLASSLSLAEEKRELCFICLDEKLNRSAKASQISCKL